MKITKNKQSVFVQSVGGDGTACPLGSFDTSARLDVQAAMIRNHTWSAGAWRTWDSQHAGAPEQYPFVAVKITVS